MIVGVWAGGYCHWPVLLWDISYGEEYHLTKRANQHKIMDVVWCKEAVGIPRARDRPGGPCQL